VHSWRIKQTFSVPTNALQEKDGHLYCEKFDEFTLIDFVVSHQQKIYVTPFLAWERCRACACQKSAKQLLLAAATVRTLLRFQLTDHLMRATTLRPALIICKPHLLIIRGTNPLLPLPTWNSRVQGFKRHFRIWFKASENSSSIFRLNSPVSFDEASKPG